MPFDHSFLSEGIDFSTFFNQSFLHRFFYHPSLLYQSMLWEGVAVACQAFLLLSCIALSVHAARDMQFYPHSLLREGIHSPTVHLFKSILHCSPIPNLRKMPFDHSFLSEGIDFSTFFNQSFLHRFFYHPSLLYQSMLWEGVAVACQAFLLLSCIALSVHAARDMQFYPHSLLREGIYFHISFRKCFLDSSILHFSPIPNLRKMPFDHSFLSGGIDFCIFQLFLHRFFYHPSLLYQSMLWEGVAVACQAFLLLSCIALSFHTARKDYSTLIHSFGGGLFIYLYLYSSFKKLF